MVFKKEWQFAAGLLTAAWLTLSPLSAEDPKAFPDGPGKEVFLRVCTRCHQASNSTKLRLTRRQWQGKVYAQADRGAEASGQDLDQIVEYLTSNFGPEKPPASDPASPVRPK